ncbi:MAG: aldo/keto reductase [Bacteroidota bacterium]|nr:aldo/keto reductase [Candidatus Kapabacteria bacterium]MDW8219426.1 aldo/keto reductase [Bacteroidota bacterium]
MEYRRLGRSGVQVSVVSLGSWLTFGSQIRNEVAEDLMRLSYDAGINFFDNAEAYAHGRSEQVMGDILRKCAWDRSTYLVSSKVYWGGDKPNQRGLSRKHVVEACHAALKRLQVEYLDLYFCHRPDKDTPIEETVWAMHTLIQQGKVLYWGTSEWSAQQIMEAYAIAREHHLVPPTMEQPQYNLFHRMRVEHEYKRLYSSIGLGTTIWSPLASGVLTGKYAAGIPEGTRLARRGLEWLKNTVLTEDNIRKTELLKPIAAELGATLPQLAIAWCLVCPHVSTVILGASTTEQLRENIAALSIVPKLTSDVLERIEAIVGNKPEPEPEY